MPARSKLAFIAVAVTLGACAPANAAIFNVNTTTDAVDASGGDGVCATAAGACTLRAAVQQSDASAGSDTINVPAGHYVLSVGSDGEDAAAEGDLDLYGGDITITGAGARKTIIDGDRSDRVFEFQDIAQVAAVSDLTVTNGYVEDNGGGIAGDATLTLTRVAVVGNEVPSTLNWNAGGIEQGSNPLTIASSTIANNKAYNGGGISMEDGSITNSTISGNTGGSLAPGDNGDDGGIDGDVVDITNSTITGNGCFNGSGCGGGFSLSAFSEFKNTIVAGNTFGLAGGGPSGLDNCDPVTSLGHNLEDTDDCNFHAAGDLVNTDPKLGPFADNGGETNTHALASNSPAINAGDNSGCPTTDQRGGSRPQPPGGICDIGAVEFGSLADLAIAMSRSPDPVDSGGVLNYALTVTNNGPDQAAAVALKDALPAGATYISVKNPQGACTGTTTINCAIGTLAKGGQAKLDLVVKPGKSGKLENTATVSGDPTDPDPANNTAKTSTTVRVAVTTLALKPSSFRPLRSGASIAKTGGATVTYTLLENAKLQFTVERAGKGRLVGGTCRAKRRSNAKRKSCTLFKKVKGRFGHSGKAGTNKFKFSGRIKKRALKPGRYRLVAVASNATGKSQPKRTNFKIKR